MKQIALRLPEEMYEMLQRKGAEINCSANSLILLLVHLGLKIYDGEAIIHSQPK